MGAIFGAIFHYWHGIMDRLFGGKTGFVNTVLKLLVDQAFFDPLMTAAYFVIWGLLEGQRGTQIERNLKAHWWKTQLMSWRVWPLASYIMFNHVPPQFRVLFGNLVAFFWSMYLSSRRS